MFIDLTVLYSIIIAITYILLYLTVEGHKLDKYVKMNKWLEYSCLDLLGGLSLISNRCRGLIICNDQTEMILF